MNSGLSTSEFVSGKGGSRCNRGGGGGVGNSRAFVRDGARLVKELLQISSIESSLEKGRSRPTGNRNSHSSHSFNLVNSLHQEILRTLQSFLCLMLDLLQSQSRTSPLLMNLTRSSVVLPRTDR